MAAASSPAHVSAGCADQADKSRLGEQFAGKWENAPSPDPLIAKALENR